MVQADRLREPLGLNVEGIEPALYLIINRTRPDLSPDDYAELARRAKDFFGAVPDGIALRGNWAEAGGGRTIALIEADDESRVEATQAPFRDYVDMEVIGLIDVEGWRDGAER